MRSDGLIDMPHPVRRGSPDAAAVVHLHKREPRLGMRESFGWDCDYAPAPVCGYGSWHIWLCDDIEKVTCEKCLSLGSGSFDLKAEV